jgi:uncharacterized protein
VIANHYLWSLKPLIMTRVALISDNHSYYGDEVWEAIQDADEIWHSGDIGDLASIKKFTDKPFKAVYGNIDEQDTRHLYPLNLVWMCEGVKVYMTHIGGYPGKYNARVLDIIKAEKPRLYICGHSHICKVMPDKVNQLIHMNPGAYGHHGFHKIRTLLRFDIDGDKITNVRAVELGLRGIITEKSVG